MEFQRNKRNMNISRKFKKYPSHFIQVNLNDRIYTLRHVELNEINKKSEIDEHLAKEWIRTLLVSLPKENISNPLYLNLKSRVGKMGPSLDKIRVADRPGTVAIAYVNMLTQKEHIDIDDLTILTMLLGGASVSDETGNVRLVSPLKFRAILSLI